MFIHYIYEELAKCGEVFDQYSFDREYLGKGKGYFANLKSTRKEPSVAVLFKLNRNLLKKHEHFKVFGFDTMPFRSLADQTFKEMERRVA